MPKLKWNDCSATMLSTRCHEGRVTKRVAVNVQKKCISLGKASDRKWVDYSNSKIFIKKRPNHEYNILRQVLSRDKRLSESLKYEVKWTDYSQHFMISPSCSPPPSPSIPSPSNSTPSSPSSSSSSLPSSPESTPSSPELRYSIPHTLAASYAGIRTITPTTATNLLAASTPELSTISIAFPDTSFLHTTTDAPSFGECSFQTQPPTVTTDPFFTEIQPLPIMELYYT